MGYGYAFHIEQFCDLLQCIVPRGSCLPLDTCSGLHSHTDDPMFDLPGSCKSGDKVRVEVRILPQSVVNVNRNRIVSTP